MKRLHFFKERGIKDNAIADMLSFLTFKEVKKDEFVIEYGQAGDEFYIILEGQCEFLVPDQQDDEFS